MSAASAHSKALIHFNFLTAILNIHFKQCRFRRHVMGVGKKVGFEPRTTGYLSKHFANCVGTLYIQVMLNFSVSDLG